MIVNFLGLACKIEDFTLEMGSSVHELLVPGLVRVGQHKNFKIKGEVPANAVSEQFFTSILSSSVRET